MTRPNLGLEPATCALLSASALVDSTPEFFAGAEKHLPAHRSFRLDMMAAIRAYVSHYLNYLRIIHADMGLASTLHVDSPLDYTTLDPGSS